MCMFPDLFLPRKNKSRDQWVGCSSPEIIQGDLTNLFTKGNIGENIGPALTAAELRNFKKNFNSISQRHSEVGGLLAFYGNYPFKPSTQPLSRGSLLRAVVILTGKDKEFDTPWIVIRDGERKTIRRGREKNDRLKILFRALAGAEPTEDDVLDVLSLIQPRPDPCQGPLDRESLRPMAVRLVETKVSNKVPIGELSISKNKLAAFLNAMGGEVPDSLFDEDVTYGDFLQILGDVPWLLEAVASKAEVFLKPPILRNKLKFKKENSKLESRGQLYEWGVKDGGRL